MLKGDQQSVILTTLCAGVLIAVAFFFSYSGMVSSGWPPQPKVVSTPQQDSTSNAKPTNDPTPAIDVRGAPQSQGPKNAEAAEAKEKTILDKRIVDLTADLAKYTGWLFYATGV